MTPQERAIEEAAKLQQEIVKKTLGKLAFDRFIAGAKSDTAKSYWFAKFQQEQDRKYSEEDMRKAFKIGHQCARQGSYNDITEQEDYDKWKELGYPINFEQYKKQ